jgi:hypothetical protein
MSNVTQLAVGSIVSLCRYPVKSIMGGELNAAAVPDGLAPWYGRSMALMAAREGRSGSPVVRPSMIAASRFSRCPTAYLSSSIGDLQGLS